MTASASRAPIGASRASTSPAVSSGPISTASWASMSPASRAVDMRMIVTPVCVSPW